MNNQKIKALEREVELLKQVIELTRQLEELKAKAPAYVPYVPYQPYWTYPNRPWWEYQPTWTTGQLTVSSDTVAYYVDGQLIS